MPHRITPRWLSRHWQVKLLCVLLACVLWLALKERTTPGTTDAVIRWLEQ